ncbi:MAG: tetratricopeptide repeat protein [Candidatus Melainabacteria bacterium]|nr:tetratricopeptide repeat protein [Candidatus Melainabacteria bacterium]
MSDTFPSRKFLSKNFPSKDHSSKDHPAKNIPSKNFPAQTFFGFAVFSGFAFLSATIMVGCAGSEEGYVKPRQEALKLTDAGRYAQAEQKLVPLVKIMQSRHAKSLANTMQQLAWIYVLDGKYKEAEELASTAKFHHDKQSADDTESQILDNYTLATIYEKEGKYDQAEPLFREAIELRRDALKKNAPAAEAKIVEAPRLASLELGLGTLEFDAGKYKEAESQLSDAVKSAEEDAVAKKSNATAILAVALEQVALVYQANGKYSDAESVCNKGLRLIHDSVGMKSPQVIFACNNLMSIYSDQHRYSEVESLVKSIWHEENEIFREGHPEILRSKLLNMTSLSRSHTEVPHAEIQAVYDRLIADYAAQYGTDSPQLVAPYQAAGEYELSIADYSKAESNLRAALALARQKLSDKHPRTISILNSLAMTLGFKGLTIKSKPELNEAKKLVREAIAKQDDSLPEDNPVRARSLGILASLYAIEDDNEGAYNIFQQYLAAAKKANYEVPVERIRFMKNYQTVLRKTGHEAEAERIPGLFAKPTPLVSSPGGK